MGTAQRHGSAGERLAAAYFELLGCSVVAQNVRLGGVEVDLVVEENGTHVIVEVKARSRSDYGGAAMAVDRAKRARLLRACAALGTQFAARIDVVAIEIAAEGARIRHYRSAVTEA